MDGREKGLLLVDCSRDAEVVASLRVGYSRKDMTSFPLTKLLCVAGVTRRCHASFLTDIFHSLVFPCHRSIIAPERR
jgi:hypothetical protein